MGKVEINNLTAVLVDKKFLKKIAEKVLESENKGDAELSIALVGRGRMKRINKKYRKKNQVTDVLSFADFKNPAMGNDLGEILICLSRVKKNARRMGISFEEELYRVLIHGLLHLLGYEHEGNPEKAKEMERRQEHYLSEFFKVEPGTRVAGE